VTKYFTVNGETQEKFLKLADAQTSINTAARMIYSRLFEWLITKVNEATKLLDDSDKVRTLGILDIFGFEIVETNNLEQLLINYANERLQQFYVMSSFQLEMQEYAKEGIATDCIKYRDNDSIISLLDLKPASGTSEKPGILELLGDVCKIETGTDEQFVNSIKEKQYPPDLFTWGKGPKEKEVFSVHHTAAKVTYTVIKFREKNMETLEKKVIDVLSDTRDRVMKEVFPRVRDADKKSGPGFMHHYLRESMNSLLEVLGDTMPYFIRCIKPNETKLPNNFNNKVTLTQLKSLSILDALYLAQNGYPHRWDYDTFLDRLHILRKVYRPPMTDSTEMANHMLEKIGVPPAGYQKGKSMIFLKKKTYRMLGDKTELVMQACNDVGEDIVRVSKRKRVKEDFDDSVRRLINIQAYARGFRERLIISKMLKRKRFLWGALLFGFRYRRFKRDRLAAFTIQTTIRELKAMATLHEKIKEKRLRTSRHRLKTFVQVLLSQRSLQMSIEDRHRRKLFDCVEKVAKL
jgi:myosin-5